MNVNQNAIYIESFMDELAKEVGMDPLEFRRKLMAACAEVSVDGNKVKIHRIVAATDPGHAANPAQVERQVAGSFAYGLTALFLGGITVKDGKVEQENFDSYDMMRIKEMPKVETIVMPSGGFWGGVGEPTIAVAAPAVLNAITARPASATGPSRCATTDFTRFKK